MGSAGIQMGCVGLGVLGLIGVIVCCVVPSWRVSSFTGSNIVTAQVINFLKANHKKYLCVQKNVLLV